MLIEEKLQDLMDAVQELLDVINDISIMAFWSLDEIMADPAVYIDDSWLAIDNLIYYDCHL